MNTFPTQKIPQYVLDVAKTLQNKGFSAYIVGGCVRDLLIGREPKDWDITTSALPDEIIAAFEHTFYENTFGTVGVVCDEAESQIVEVTPFRSEFGYSDNRRPDKVEFGVSLEVDLARRDFTINAIAYDPIKGQIIDPYKGQDDIGQKAIKAVGNPVDRFTEDGLRIMRAVRFSAELGFTIQKETEIAICAGSSLLKNISQERIRDEFTKIIMSDNPMDGIITLHQLELLQYIVPELEKAIEVEQNQAHSYDVWTHLLKSLQHAADKGYPFHVRLTALFHDIGKPASRRFDTQKNEWTFYGHEVVGAREAKKILERLKYPKETVTRVTKLVRWHMFFSDPAQITLSAVRRMIVNVGKDMIWDLMNVRKCDRIGTGRPKEQPYRFRKYTSMIDEALRDPITVGMLKIDGARLMEVTRENPGPRLGFMLHALLEEVLEDPAKNTAEYLDNRAIELSRETDEKLKQLGESGKKKKEIEDAKLVDEIREKHHVS